MAKKPIPAGTRAAKPKPKPKPAPRKPRAKPTPAPAPPPIPGSTGGPAVALADKKGYLERVAARKALGAAKIANIKRGRRMKGYAKAGGIAALAALGAGLGYNRVQTAMGTSEAQLMNKALADLMGQHRQMQMNALVEEAKSESYEDSIGRNLQRIQQQAPDLYMAVAAGRRLPTGAVVLGGAPRTDLLQDLGRSMSDGQYT